MSFRVRILLATAAVLVAALATAMLGGSRWLRQATEQTLADESARAARLIAVSLPRDVGRIQGVTRQLGRLIGRRVTVIDSTGLVIGDSDFDDASLRLLENHLERPEVQAALQSGAGRSLRHSTSTRRTELKVAVRAWPGVVRVSIPADQIAATLTDAQRVALLAGLV
ncbi:MAG: hypothetical protein WEC54_05770, partial [Gemmatimonadales bacterium]